MQIAEFQRWTKNTDRETQWDLITTPQLVSHLTEEIGEVAQSVNRIYGYSEEEKKAIEQTWGSNWSKRFGSCSKSRTGSASTWTPKRAISSKTRTSGKANTWTT